MKREKIKGFTMRLSILTPLLLLLLTFGGGGRGKPLLSAEESPLSPPSLSREDLPQEGHPTQPPAPSTMSFQEPSLTKTFIILVGLLTLLILTLWMLKKFASGRLHPFGTQKSIKVLERRPLSPKSVLYLIEIEGKQLLISESQGGVRQLTTLDWLDEEKGL